MKRIILLAVILTALLSNLDVVHAQMKVSGSVCDETSSPIPGVNVVEKGTNNGTITDLNGKYTIIVSNSTTTLSFSFIGCINQEVEVKNKTEINIILIADNTALDEVVVVSCGLAGRVPGMRIRGSSRNSRSKRKNSSTKYAPATSYYNAPTLIANNESYVKEKENGFKQIINNPLSTFSIDVDRASYSNVRRFINNGQLPPSDAVRVEEMINYFSYDYPKSSSEHPIDIYTEVSDCPWNSNHLVMQVGMKASDIKQDELPRSNLVFLIDVSGSMGSYNKLPLVKRSLQLLTQELRDEDRVAIVVYAGAAGLVLPSTKGSDKEKIKAALNNLNAGGSTAGGAGIKLAYATAEKHFVKNGNNRVIIATDGDFNVGASSDKEMETLIEEKRNSGIFLTCLGYGMGNYKDSKLETLADKGNGNYAYIDNIQEAEKTLVQEFSGTMFTIAKDVKIQIEFNPALVEAYRLIGYENRLLNDEDFKDDTKDAGEIGAGHTVTALYEIIPKGVNSKFIKDIDKLKYQNTKTANNEELATVKVRYKPVDTNKSIPFEQSVFNSKSTFSESSDNLRFATSVAMFGMLLSQSKYIEGSDYKDVLKFAQSSKANDTEGYKAEFVRLVKAAQSF